jgi:shikimate dehydrogenase
VKAAVLGSPIAHSLSPALHQAGYAALGLDDWSYTAIECAEAGLPDLIASRGPGWAGLSLTMPLKRAVLPLLDTVDPVATDTGGANTVIFDGDRRHGYNTDVAGMVAALAEAGLTAPKSAVILGAGATACSAVAALRDLGLTAVTVAVRDPARAGGLLAVAARLGVEVTLAPLAAQRDGELPPPDLLISTLPAGAADFFTEGGVAGVPVPPWVFDVVYAPWPTRLAQATGQAGATVVGGFELLLHQAAGQFELMTGRPAPLEAMRAGGQAELDRRSAGSARLCERVADQASRVVGDVHDAAAGHVQERQHGLDVVLDQLVLSVHLSLVAHDTLAQAGPGDFHPGSGLTRALAGPEGPHDVLGGHADLDH